LDYDREMGLVAERLNRDTGACELLGIGRLVRQPDAPVAELGVMVGDRWQGMGLGTELVRRSIEIAKTEGLRCIRAEILSENACMLALARHFHFSFVRTEDPRSLTAILTLDSSRPATQLASPVDVTAVTDAVGVSRNKGE
jgi:acetyltransferase